MACNVVSSIKVDFGNLVRKIEKQFIESEGEITPSAFSKIREESINYLKQVKQKALDLGYSFTDEDLIELSRFIDMRINKSGCPKLGDNIILGLILNPESVNNFVTDKVVNTSSLDDVILSKREYKRDFIDKIYLGAEYVKRLALNTINYNFANTLLFDRDKGRITKNVSDLNTNIKDLLNDLFKIVFDYLKKYYSNSKNRLTGVDYYDIYNSDTVTMYDNDGNYTGNFEKLYKSAFNVFNTYDSFKLNFLYLKKDDALKAFNAFQTLLHFDEFLINSFGDLIKISNINTRFTSQNKYSIESKATNMFWSNSKDDDIDLSKSINNISKLIIGTTRMYDYRTGNIIPDTYLTFNHFSDVITKLKDLALNKRVSESIYLNQKDEYGTTLFNLNSLSSESKNFIKKLGNKATFANLLNRIRENPYESLTAIFELLTSMDAKNIKVLKPITNLFNIEERNAIMSIGKELFNKNESKSLRSIQDILGYDPDPNKNVNYLGYILQTSDTSGIVKNCLYGYNLEEQENMLQSLYNSNILTEKRFIKDAINILNSPIVNNSDIDLLASYSNNVFKFKFNYNGLILNGAVTNNGVFTINGSNLDDFISLKFLENRDLATSEFLKFIDNFLHLDFLNNKKYFDNLLLVYYDSKKDNEIIVFNNLLKFAIKLLHGLYAVRKISEDLDKSDNNDNKEEQIKELAKKYINEEVKVVFDYGTIDIIPKTLSDTIDYIAIAKSLTNGDAISSQVNDSSGNPISNSTPSRLLSNFTTLFDEIVKDTNSPANHFDLINDKNILIDIQTVREFLSQGETKLYNLFNTREFMETSLLIDFLGMFNDSISGNNYNLLKNKAVGVTPTVNSDKNTISKMVLNSNEILFNIFGKNISILDFLKNYSENRGKLIEYINKQLGSYYNTLNTLLENDLIKLSSSSNFFKLVTDGLILEYNYKSFDQFNAKLQEFNSRFKQGLFNTQFLDTNLIEFEEGFVPWKDDPSKTKKVLNIYLKGLRNKGYFQLVADTDFNDTTLYNGEYSVHFKTVNEKGEGYSENVDPSTREERAILYKELIKAIPYGAVVSTWGEISDGGIIALSKVTKGWKRIGKRSIFDKQGNPIKIGKFKKPLLNTRLLFNIASRESKVDIKDLLHAVFSPNEIKLNNSIKLALSRYTNKKIDLEYYLLKNSELVLYLVNNKVVIDLVNNDHILNFLQNNGLQDWISDSGTLIFAKYLTSNGNIIDIKSEADFKLISLTDPIIKEALDASNSELKYSPHLLSNRLSINPVVETWNMMNYLYSLEYLIGTVGSHVNHPNKRAIGLPKNLIEYLNDEAARFLALHKRNVSLTAAMHEFLLNQINGIPTYYNISVIEDINDLVYNLAGDLSEAKPFDGATIVNPFIVYLENNSLCGEKAGIHKKLFVHFYDTRTGTGGIIKTAGFGITNSWMKNSPFLLRIMKNMTDILWTDKDGNPIYVDITKKYQDRPLDSTNLLCYNIYYSESVKTSKGWTNKYYKIKNIEYKGNGTYELTRVEVTNNGSEKIGTENLEVLEGINSNYKVWKYIFKGLNSVNFNKNGVLSNRGHNGETSISNTVLAINSCGFGDMITLESYYQPMKHSDTHYLVTEGAIKLGGANFNTKDSYYKDEVYNRFKIKMLLAGILLDKEHHADNSEISMMTLVVSACAALGYTWNESNKIYKALRTLTENGIENLTKPLRELLKVNTLENRVQFNKVIADLIVKSLKNSSNSKDGVIYNITYNLIEKYRNGLIITNLDIINNPIPISDPVLFNKIQSLISSYLTSSAIKMKFRGILSVLVPSHEIMKLYGDRLYSSFNNPLEEIKELLKVFDSKFLNISDIEIGRTYKIINPSTGKVVDRVHIQAPFMKEKHKNNVYGDPSLVYTDYYELRNQFTDEYKDCVLVEDITNGRNLGAYFCTFEGIKGDKVEKYNFYDLVESKLLYQGTIDGKIGRKLLQERLANLKEGSTVIVDINGIKSEVIVRNLNIKPYEVIMPKIFATLLGLTEEDDLFKLKDDKNSFKKKIIDNISNKIHNEEAFTVTLKRLNGDHMYILSKEQFDKYGLHDLIEVTVDPPVKDLSSNDIYRESNGEYLYSMASLNDKIYQIDGKEVIVTDNVDFYIENLDYNFLYVSSKASNKQFNSILKNRTIKNKAFKNWKKLVTTTNLFFIENGELEEKPLTIVDIKNKNKQLNNLRFNNTTGTIQFEGVDIDNNLSDFINNLGDELYTSFIKSLDLIAARIPAQSMQSFMPMKVVGYEDFDINTAYVCTHQIWLLGSDYDIDAVSLLTFELSKSGLFVGWSPYFNYSSIEHLNIACGLELPTGKDIEKVNERDLFTNITSKEDLLEKLADYVTDIFFPFLILRVNNEIKLIDKSDDLITYLQKVNVINKLVTLGILDIENSSEVLKNDILNIYNERFLDMKVKNTDELITLFKLLEEIVNEHNNYLNTSKDIKSMSKNFIVLNIYNISMSLSNLILALMSVDQTTDEPKSIANNSEKGKLLNNATPGNIGNVFLSIEDNHVGKDVIGISAVGLKSFFAITQYINTILNDPKNTSETIELLLYKPLTFNGKEYITIANANLRNNENNRINLLILNKLLENNDHDAALLISALLSLATDNAKELCLSKLNANARMAGMYIYGLTMGVPFLDLGKLLMSDIGDMVAQYLKGSIITDNLKLNSIDSVLKFLNNPVSVIAKIYKGTSLYNKENQKGIEKVWYEVKSDVNKIVQLLKENNDIFNTYYDEVTNNDKKRFNFESYLRVIIENINGDDLDNDLKLELIDNTILTLYKVKQVAFKRPFKNKNGKIVKYSLLNYYLKNRAIDDLIEGFNSMYKIKLSESKLWDGAFVDFISLHLGATELNMIGNLLGANQGVKNKYEDFLTFVNNFEDIISKRKKTLDTYKKYYTDSSDEEINTELDFNRFIIDEDYRNEKILEYDKIAFSFNPLRIINTVPLYRGYIDSVGTKHGTLLVGSIKYRTMYNHLNKINNIIGYVDLSSKISSLDNLISYKIINQYFANNNKYFIIPQGSKIITLSSETESEESEAKMPTKIFLGTLGGNATFKKWMESEVIPNLKLGYTSSDKKIRLPSISNNEFIKSLIPRKFTKNANKLPSTSYSSNVDMSPRTEEGMAILDRLRLSFDLISNSYTMLDENGNKVNIPIKDLFYWYDLITYNGKLRKGSLTKIFDNYATTSESLRLKLFTKELDDSDLMYYLSDEEIIKWGALVENPYSSFSKWIYYKDTKNLTMLLLLQDTSEDVNTEGEYYNNPDRIGNYVKVDKIKFDTNYILHRPTNIDRTLYKTYNNIDVTYDPVTRTITEINSDSINKELLKAIIDKLNTSNLGVLYDPNTGKYAPNLELIDGIIEQILCKQ